MKSMSICDSRYPSFRVTNDLFLRRDPFDLLEGFFGLDSFLEEGARAPAIDVRENEGAYLIEAELPGLSEKDVRLEVKDGILNLSVEKKAEEAREAPETKAETSEGRYLRRERRSFAFARSFSLPENADQEKIEARFKDGLLSIAIPKKPEVAPRQVPVRVA